MRPDFCSRRSFLGAAAAGGLALTFGKCLAAPDALLIESPASGAVLHRRHGRQSDDGLEIEVRGLAPLEQAVLVNGSPAQRAGKSFRAAVTLREHENEILAVTDGFAGRQEHRIRVIWDRHSRPRYRFSIDDNSFFLRDIAQKQYASLFECGYLGMLRDLNRKYGTKFVLNTYFTTGDDFDLTQFPDRYKSEWADNADWLKLAFHARADKPDRPYQYASPQQLAADFDAVAEQILRFAGEQTYSPPTIIHWGMVLPAALPVLRDRGVRVLSGYFHKSGGLWDVNYHFDAERSEYMSRHDAWMDFASGIVFSRVDIVCNSVPVDQIVPTLAPLTENPDTAEIMDILTHEQYFWPFYQHYLPDHPQRLETAVRWLTEQGYQPVFFHEGFLGVPA
ncbi:MAG: twin-arginine translocation signal domain-containing protein [Thermogutta sp.]|nr:twin-arginine translocation signal domain-containing protein [Thermogutta sp.]